MQVRVHLGLGLGRVVDLLGEKKVEVVVQRATLNLDVVDLDLVGVVRVDNESVQVGKLIRLAGNGLLGQEILALVREDDVDLAVAGAADIGAEHDVVRRLTLATMHVLLVDRARENLDVATTAVNGLLVLDSELRVSCVHGM